MDALTVELVLPATVTHGDLVVGEVIVRNTGDTPVTVSAWLGLAEGDLWLEVRDPAGRDRTVHGRYPLDVLPQQATLDPGEAIARGLQLAAVSPPQLFDQPGDYRLRAVYAPGAGAPTVRSPQQTLVVEPARAGGPGRVGDLLDGGAVGDAVADALAMGHVDAGAPAAGALGRLAADRPGSPDAAAARIVLAASAARDGAGVDWGDALAGLDPAALARLVTALQPPADAGADPLTAAALARVAPADAWPAGARAAAMLRGQPFRASPC